MSTTARTPEPSFREWLVGQIDDQERQIQAMRGVHCPSEFALATGKLIGLFDCRDEIDRREAAPTITLDSLMAGVAAERKRQNDKWGVQRHSWGDWMLILGEEIGESCQASLNVLFSGADLFDLRNELIQSAAVIAAIVEHIDEISAVESAAKGGV